MKTRTSLGLTALFLMFLMIPIGCSKSVDDIIGDIKDDTQRKKDPRDDIDDSITPGTDNPGDIESAAVIAYGIDNQGNGGGLGVVVRKNAPGEWIVVTAGHVADNVSHQPFHKVFLWDPQNAQVIEGNVYPGYRHPTYDIASMFLRDVSAPWDHVQSIFTGNQPKGSHVVCLWRMSMPLASNGWVRLNSGDNGSDAVPRLYAQGFATRIRGGDSGGGAYVSGGLVGIIVRANVDGGGNFIGDRADIVGIGPIHDVVNALP